MAAMRALVCLLALAGCTNTVGEVPDSGVVAGAEGEGEGEGGEGEGEGEGCPPDPVFGLVVVVEDAVTQFPICDATVGITDGNFTETLAPRGAAPDCDYAGAQDRPGVYDVLIQHPDYAETTREDIEVFGDDCGHAVFRRIVVGLSSAEG